MATDLGLSIAGASKLLKRTRAAKLFVEITRRKTWRLLLTPDLAAEFGFVAPKRGRPAQEPPPLPRDRELAAVVDAFDQQMAEIDHLLCSRNSLSGV